MLSKFFEKHIDTFEAKDALKLIDKKVDASKEYCSEHNPKYLEELAHAYQMIEDYFVAINVPIESVIK